MESNEQTTNKQNKDRLIDREQVESSWGLESTGMDQKRKGFMDMDNSVVIMEGRKVGGGRRGYKGDKW